VLFFLGFTVFFSDFPPGPHPLFFLTLVFIQLFSTQMYLALDRFDFFFCLSSPVLPPVVPPLPVLFPFLRSRVQCRAFTRPCSPFRSSSLPLFISFFLHLFFFLVLTEFDIPFSRDLLIRALPPFPFKALLFAFFSPFFFSPFSFLFSPSSYSIFRTQTYRLFVSWIIRCQFSLPHFLSRLPPPTLSPSRFLSPCFMIFVLSSLSILLQSRNPFVLPTFSLIGESSTFPRHRFSPSLLLPPQGSDGPR